MALVLHLQPCGSELLAATEVGGGGKFPKKFFPVRTGKQRAKTRQETSGFRPQRTIGGVAQVVVTRNRGFGALAHAVAKQDKRPGGLAQIVVTQNKGLGALAHAVAKQDKGPGEPAHAVVTQNKGPGALAWALDKEQRGMR